MSSLQARLLQAFETHFGGQPTLLARGPGRVNLIGEHTDYNDGFVLPMAIDRAVWIALRPRDDGRVLVHALDYNQSAEFAAMEPVKGGASWSEYLKGVAWAMREAGHSLAGWEGVVSGDVPHGAGLSSSAAIEMATARAFCAVSDIEWEGAAMAQLGQRAENGWVGVKTGIMDQMISANGVEDSAVLIDCRWLTLTPAPLPPGTSIVVMDTATRRELVTSAYNERREQCEAAAKFFNVPALRDVTMEQFKAATDMLDPLVAKRARHVISENGRTLRALEALSAGDPVAFGLLMNASHVSMRDDFAITRAEVDAMVECAQAHRDCYGARMTGGGFGGCCVALVRADAAEAFAAHIANCYPAATGLTPILYICQASQGATIQAV